MDVLEKIYHDDIAEVYDKEQNKLREEVKDKIKDGLNNIPKNLDCCFNCNNFNKNCSKCVSEESAYSNKSIPNVLINCYFFKK